MTTTKKDCFGVLDKVFPMGKEGLREVVPSCFECNDRKTCLEAALATKQGLEFRSELLYRIPASGLVGRLKRWSEKKELNRLIKQEQDKK